MSRRVPVLVAGGGPVGLALAVELGWRGIACELVEQGDGTLTTPKMNEVNARSMEFCRRWGISDKVLNCPFPADYPLDVAFVTSLAGHELSRLPRAPRNSQEPMAEGPHRMQACSQIWFDPMLREHALTFPPVRLRYRCRLESFEQDAAGVTAQLTDLATGARETLAADYLVGCDGAGSLVRRALGIELVGQGTIGHPINLFFRAPVDLIERCGKRPATFFLGIDETGLWGNLRIIDPKNGLWRLMIDSTDGSLTPETVDRDAYLRRALGAPVDVQWVEVNIWRRRSALAQSYGLGRVFLAGDAVHQLSPTGGMGMNTGLADAVDIGWKLAAVLEGWGGPGLLDSYDAERRPVGERAVRMATHFYKNSEKFPKASAMLTDDSEAGERHRRDVGERLLRAIGPEFRTVGLQLGYRYEGSPICVPDGTAAPPDDPADYTASARPGSRAPHVWLKDGRSTLDLFGRGFTLLRFHGAPDAGAIEGAARDRGVPLRTVDLDAPEAARLYERKLVLVRPDGHVAWCADVPPTDSGALIDRVRGAV
ncbi:MAG: 2-polyprenyl-6-methoxyphenol hydroxylase [Alphaproteobacteria bacterium]|nr:2-polyprenyl-6-methoxyphenol hydroxylase [Alphaproteobacteria bacterium]